MENKETKREMEIDMRHILQVIWRRSWIVLLVGVLFGAIGFGYAKLTIVPEYSSNVMFYVNNQQEGSDGFTSSQVTAAQELARTYMVILETYTVLDTAQTKANENAIKYEEEEGVKAIKLSYNYAQLKNMVTAQAVDETDVFIVTVTSNSPREAFLLAEALEDVLPEVVNTDVEGSRLRMVDPARPSNTPVGPTAKSYSMLGFVLGVGLGLLVTVLAAIMDTTIHSEDYLSNTYSDLPLLAVIPSVEEAKTNHYGNYSPTAPQGSSMGGAK